MNRASFIKNLLGSAAAITIAPKLQALLPIPDVVPATVPGIGRAIFRIKVTRGMFMSGDIVLGTTGGQYFLSHTKDGGLIGTEVQGKAPGIVLEEVSGECEQLLLPLCHTCPEGFAKR